MLGKTILDLTKFNFGTHDLSVHAAFGDFEPFTTGYHSGELCGDYNRNLMEIDQLEFGKDIRRVFFKNKVYEKGDSVVY